MKFRDVCHHYIGCEVRATTDIEPEDSEWMIKEGETLKLYGVHAHGETGDETVSNFDTYGVVLRQGDKWVGTHISDIKPILLSLEDMTNEHRTELQNLTVFGDWPEISKQFHYLTSKGYDVFGLIESGEAIRKTK